MILRSFRRFTVRRLYLRLSLFALILFTCIFSGCTSPGAMPEVHSSGAARNVMTGADLSVTVSLDTLAGPGFTAIGPAESVRGEITAIDGRVFVSRISEGQVFTEENPSVKAPFLAYTYVNDWETVTLHTALNGLKDLEQLADSMRRARGIPVDRPFPFRINFRPQRLDFHIIMRDTTETVHSHEAHAAAKVKFSERKGVWDLVGFYSRNHEGVFTHKGRYIHVHAISADRKVTGHLDGIAHKGGLSFSLPAN